MAEHTTNAGYGTRRIKTLWFSLSKGRFNFKLEKDGEAQQCDSVWGVYVGHQLRWKPKSGDIPAHDELIITLSGTDANGEATQLKVSMRFPAASSNGFAQVVDNIMVGNPICLETWASKDNEKISYLKVQFDQAGNLIPIPRREDRPKFDQEALDRALHSAKSPKQRQEIEDEHRRLFQKELEEWARPILEAHEGYSEGKKEEATEETYEPGDEPTGALSGPVNSEESGEDLDIWEIDSFSAYGTMGKATCNKNMCIDFLGEKSQYWHMFCEQASKLEFSKADAPALVRAVLRQMGVGPTAISRIESIDTIPDAALRVVGSWLLQVYTKHKERPKKLGNDITFERKRMADELIKPAEDAEGDPFAAIGAGEPSE